MTVLLNDPASQTPTTSGALAWKNQFSLTSIYVAADPNFSMVPTTETEIGTPMQTVINPRTMQVVLRQEGFSGSAPPQLLQIAQQNNNN